MILIVCGGRDFADRAFLFAALDAVHRKRPITKLAQGCCPTGADAFAVEWAKARGVFCIGFQANWAEFGASAGPRRNRQMLDYGVDGVVAFPGGRGTADMVRIARAAGVTVWEPKPDTKSGGQ